MVRALPLAKETSPMRLAERIAAGVFSSITASPRAHTGSMAESGSLLCAVTLLAFVQPGKSRAATRLIHAWIKSRPGSATCPRPPSSGAGFEPLKHPDQRQI